MPERNFFWCTNATWQFSALPEANFACESVLNQIQTYFFGEHERLIVDGKGFSPYAQICSTVKLPARGLTELERLAYVVRSIEFNC